MIDWVLTALVLLPFVNWPATIILVRLAAKRPHIRALIERAVYSGIVSAFTTIYALVVIGDRSGIIAQFLDTSAAHNIIRLAVIVIGLYPLIWLWTYWTGRFRDGED